MQNLFLDQILIEALDKSIVSEEFKTLLKQLACSPLIEELEETIYYEFQEKGITCIFNLEKVLKAIHLYGEEKEGFSVYSDRLPNDLSFQIGKTELLQKLGTPAFKGGGERSLLGGVMPNWVKYCYPQYELHVEFKNGDREIAMVTLMVPRDI